MEREREGSDDWENWWCSFYLDQQEWFLDSMSMSWLVFIKCGGGLSFCAVDLRLGRRFDSEQNC